MEILQGGGDASRPRDRAAAVGLSLLLLGTMQGAALLRTPSLPGDARIEALPNGYSYGLPDQNSGLATIGFQLGNTGGRTVRVLAAGRDGPGLELIDVAVSGAPVGFRAAGAGAELLPAFDLRPELVVEVLLTYRVLDCAAVPSTPFPVTFLLAAGRAEQVVEVALPRYPSDRADAAPGEEDEWQTVLVKDLCG